VHGLQVLSNMGDRFVLVHKTRLALLRVLCLFKPRALMDATPFLGI